MRSPPALILVLCLFCLFSCSKKGGNLDGKGKQIITIAGSTSVLPFTEKLAEHFMKDNPDYIVDVQGGGSTAGIQATLNGTVDIGMSSRKLKEGEDLNQITICYDGIAIIVNPKNPIENLSLREVREIFSGAIKNWREIGWVDRRIDAVTREEGSGTRGAFEELVMKGKEISDAIMVQDSNGSVKEVVATDPYAIGYISLGIADKRVKIVAIDGVKPTVDLIKVGRYNLVRPFLYLTKGEPDARVKRFIEFVLSKKGQCLLKSEGLIGAWD
jgi:phosphate transport system substrate-binding protein